MIKLIFLGTADAFPSSKRNHSSILLSYEDENILVDCGEGTQRQLRKAKINPCKITRILITHWHGDHVLGIPGLLQTLAFSQYNKTLFVYGPKGTKKYMQEMMKTFAFVNKLKTEVREIDGSGKFLDEKDFYLEAEKMTHGAPCNAYNFVKKGKLRIDKNKLKKANLPAIPLIKKLKEGKDIAYEGKKYKYKNLTYEADSLKISFVLDTSFNKKIIPFVRDSDLFVCESTFSSHLESKAREHNHMTASQAAETAKKAKVKKLYLTHLSQRYENKMDIILKEAKKIFKNSFVAEDLKEVEVK
jgi:ribonuclease Z